MGVGKMAGIAVGTGNAVGRVCQRVLEKSREEQWTPGTLAMEMVSLCKKTEETAVFTGDSGGRVNEHYNSYRCSQDGLLLRVIPTNDEGQRDDSLQGGGS